MKQLTLDEMLDLGVTVERRMGLTQGYLEAVESETHMLQKEMESGGVPKKYRKRLQSCITKVTAARARHEAALICVHKIIPPMHLIDGANFNEVIAWHNKDSKTKP